MSDIVLARACRVLCKRVGLAHLWTDNGPSAEARRLRDADGGPLSSGERVIVLAAWAVWNGEGGLLFGDVVERLYGPHIEALCSLLVAHAAGDEALRGWVEREQAR
jgi:hypothetical protein